MLRQRSPDRPRAAFALLVWLGLLAHVALASTASAQARAVGPQDCEKCHKAALRKWKFEEPAQQGARAHANTHKQLSAPKAAQYAQAIGQADPLDPKGRCASCHATIVRGVLRFGVTCESCHGAASAWNPVHDKEPLPESYTKALALGLRDLHAKPAAIAALCVSCHVTPEKALAAAGHPNGAGFDAGASLAKLVHWTGAFTGDGSVHARYDAAAVSAAAKPLVARALSSGATGARAVVSPKLPTNPSASPPASPRAASPSGGTAAAAQVPTTGPAPWDWDQPVAALPDDYPSDEASPPAPQPSGEVAVERPVRRPRADARSTAPDVPVVPAADVVYEAPQAAASVSATSTAAALRGEALLLLETLLARGPRAAHLPRTRAPQEFKGPDSELLALQDVVFYLALETLRQPAPAKAKEAR